MSNEEKYKEIRERKFTKTGEYVRIGTMRSTLDGLFTAKELVSIARAMKEIAALELPKGHVAHYDPRAKE
jgi:hypothetical protein